MAERPTPHSIAVCTLIALHSDPSSPLHEIDFNPHENSDVIGKFLEICVVGEKANWTNATALQPRSSSITTVGRRHPWMGISLALWIKKLKIHVGHDLRVVEDNHIEEEESPATVVDLVLDQLRVASGSIEAMMDLMDSLRAAISEGLVDAVSAHGVYIRQVSLGFEELSFESVNLLWQALKDELSIVEEEQQMTTTTSAQDNKNQPQRSQQNPGNANIPNSTDTLHYWPPSVAQTERLLRNACLALQGGSDIIVGDYLRSNNEEDQSTYSTFEAVELEILQLLEQDPEMPAAYFLRYLNCLQHGERMGAVDALHQYFDYAMIQHSTPKDILQFAAILLASTHSAFGDRGLSFLATDEAVRVAQQSKDAACVAFALGWLYYNNGESSYGSNALLFEEGGERHGQGGELLRRCVTRAAQGQLRPLYSGANMVLAQHYLEDERAVPTAAWTRLMDASVDPVTDTLVTMDRPTHMNENTQEAMECLARQRLVSAGIWDSFGLPAISGLASLVALHCHGTEHLIKTEALTAIQNVARCALYGTQSNKHSLLDASLSPPPESSSNSWFQKPLMSAPDNDAKLSCVYATSLHHLLELKKYYKLGGIVVDDLCMLDVCLVLHEWAVRRGDLKDAEDLGVVLESYLHPRLANYHQVMVDVFLQKSLRHTRQGRWDDARAITNDLIVICKKRGFKTQHARLLIHLAHIQLESSPSRFISALSPLLEGLSMCERCQMDGLHATCMSILAKIFLRLRNPKRGIAILQATLPSLFQQEHVWFQAEALLTLGKCYLQLATASADRAASSKNNSRQTKYMRSAARELKKCQDLFQQCHDSLRLREVLYLQARVYDLLGSVTERDAASTQFIQVSKHLQHNVPAVSAKSACILDCLAEPKQLEWLASRTLPLSVS